MPDIFEVFSDHATTYLDFNGTRFMLEYRPSVLTPKLFAELTQQVEQELAEEAKNIVTGDDGQEYTVFTPGDVNANKPSTKDPAGTIPSTLEKVLISWDVQVKGETVPITKDAMMAIPTVFLGAVWQAIVNDQSQSSRKTRRVEAKTKGRVNSFQ